MSADEAHLLDVAQQLAVHADVAKPTALQALSGGKNNRVFRVTTEHGPPLVLKSYFRDPRDTRDRRRAEWSFLEHAWRHGVRNIPQPLASDADEGVALYGFLSGDKLAPGAVAPHHVDAALAFVAAVNPRPRDSMVLAPASEACFSLSEHLATVERRVARLGTLDADAPHGEAAARLVADRLLPSWHRVSGHIKSEAGRRGLALDAQLVPRLQCLSPSDFGFHNALVDETGCVGFLDFEYAGRDDPAKLVSDFFCQPEIPVPVAHHSRFVAAIAGHLELDDAFTLRAHLLLDAYRIKWACIMLNDFLAVGAARRAFAISDSWAARCAAQLAKARAKLAEISSN